MSKLTAIVGVTSPAPSDSTVVVVVVICLRLREVPPLIRVFFWIDPSSKSTAIVGVTSSVPAAPSDSVTVVVVVVCLRLNGLFRLIVAFTSDFGSSDLVSTFDKVAVSDLVVRVVVICS